MQLKYIKAISHPMGNRVDLQWFNPLPGLFNGVRIRRKEASHPVSPEDGVLVAEKENTKLFDVDSDNLSIKNSLDNKTLPAELLAYFLNHKNVLSMHAVVSVIEPGNRWEISDKDHIYLIIKNNEILEVYGMGSFMDQGLRSEVVYYYTFFPYKSNPREYIFHQSNRVSVMASGPYDFAGQLYRMLPQIYHRYDKVLPVKNLIGIPEEDKQKGQLQRFLDLPGMQLDQIYSFAAAARDLHNIDRVDGKLLPLLGQWIGWITDYNLEIAGQRNELKKAPALYETIGIIPSLEAVIVKCIGGWKSRTKEFGHNVFLSNTPERINLWLCHWDESEGWQESENVFSLDFAYEGRPAAAQDEYGTLWLFYHTRRNGHWDIWYKTFQQDKGWAPSQPLCTGNTNTLDKHPAAALQDKTLWVFWNSYDREKQTREIQCRQRTNGQWLDIELPATGNQRKSPQAVVDHNKCLWLFWLEKVGTRWQMKYNRYNGQAWEFDPSVDFPADRGDEPRVEKDLFVLFHTANSIHSIWVFWARKKLLSDGGRGCWEIAFRKKTGAKSIEKGWGNIKTLPKDSSDYDDCESAAIVNADDEIELFWASNRSGRSWAVWTIKLKEIDSTGLDSAEIPINNPYSQRAPLPIPMDNGISLVYRSNRSVSYQSDLYRATETTDFRYAGCVTIDTRNKARNAAQGMYDDFQTYTYDTGENGKPTNNDWYARDTVGFYLTPDTDDLRLITRNQEVIKGILERFLPIQNRTIFIIEPPIYKELIYTYDFSEEDKKDPRHIEEHFVDELTCIETEAYPGVREESEDKVPGWISFYSWSKEFPAHHTVDFSTSPIDAKFRTLHIRLRQFEGQHNICIPPDEYPGAKDSSEDKVPGWTWVCSWSEQSPDHYSVDFSKTPVTTKFRTWHRGIKK